MCLVVVETPDANGNRELVCVMTLEAIRQPQVLQFRARGFRVQAWGTVLRGCLEARVEQDVPLDERGTEGTNLLLHLRVRQVVGEPSRRIASRVGVLWILVERESEAGRPPGELF